MYVGWWKLELFQGGAIHAVNADVKIYSCTFERNQANGYVSAYIYFEAVLKHS